MEDSCVSMDGHVWDLPLDPFNSKKLKLLKLGKKSPKEFLLKSIIPSQVFPII
jgi:hypothetical protein